MEDDIRKSPALNFIQGLLAAGGQITAHDPSAKHQAEKVRPSRSVCFCKNPFPRRPAQMYSTAKADNKIRLIHHLNEPASRTSDLLS